MAWWLCPAPTRVIRPWFIARGAQLPFLLTVLGVLGGAIAFGLLGIFLGPVLLGIGYTLVNEWAEAEEALTVGSIEGRHVSEDDDRRNRTRVAPWSGWWRSWR